MAGTAAAGHPQCACALRQNSCWRSVILDSTYQQSCMPCPRGWLVAELGAQQQTAGTVDTGACLQIVCALQASLRLHAAWLKFACGCDWHSACSVRWGWCSSGVAAALCQWWVHRLLQAVARQSVLPATDQDSHRHDAALQWQVLLTGGREAHRSPCYWCS